MKVTFQCYLLISINGLKQSKGGLPLDSHWSHDLAKGNKQISASLNATSHSIRTQSATRQIFVETLVKWSENGLESVEHLSKKFLKVV